MEWLPIIWTTYGLLIYVFLIRTITPVIPPANEYFTASVYKLQYSKPRRYSNLLPTPILVCILFIDT